MVVAQAVVWAHSSSDTVNNVHYSQLRTADQLILHNLVPTLEYFGRSTHSEHVVDTYSYIILFGIKYLIYFFRTYMCVNPNMSNVTI